MTADNTAPEDVHWATRFHETYERLAPIYGYKTRPDTRKFDPTSQNGQLMCAVMRELVIPALDRTPEARRSDVEMSTCTNCGSRYPSAPVGVIHKCGSCSGGMMKRDNEAAVPSLAALTAKPVDAPADVVETFARELEEGNFANVSAVLAQHMCCTGYLCGCQGATVGEYLAHELRSAALRTQSAVSDGGDHAGLVAELDRLHKAARGREFDLVPTDGPIARLALFVHERGDEILAALTAKPVDAPADVVERAYREGHLTGRCGGSLMSVDEDWTDSDALAALRTQSAVSDDSGRVLADPPYADRAERFTGRSAEEHRAAALTAQAAENAALREMLRELTNAADTMGECCNSTICDEGITKAHALLAAPEQGKPVSEGGNLCDCGKPATTKYEGDAMCEACATYCARRDFEEDDMPGGFA